LAVAFLVRIVVAKFCEIRLCDSRNFPLAPAKAFCMPLFDMLSLVKRIYEQLCEPEALQRILASFSTLLNLIK
jgi:hypothetical protein